MSKSFITIAVLPAAATLVLTALAPATAASRWVTDPHDIRHGVDLRAVQVRNSPDRVVVTTTHTDLRRDPATGSGGAVYLDTDPAHRGPEYVFVGGYFAGTDYQLLHSDGFGRRAWGPPAEGGSYRMTVDYSRDTVRMWMSRAALGHPGAVRAAVRVSGARTDGTDTGLVDWLGRPRSFTPWVARG